MNKKIRWIVRLLFILYLLYIGCVIASNRGIYSFLLLNTFLAYIPIEIGMHLNEKQPKWLFWTLLVLWLIFYPNAPYVLTDLFHLSKINPYDAVTGLMVFNLRIWWHYGNLVFSALLSSLFGVWSLSYVSEIISRRYYHDNSLFKILIVGILIISSSIGVYIGRFLRLHTVYLFTNPNEVLNELIQMWNTRMLSFVILIAIFQALIWLIMSIYQTTFNSLNNNEKVI